MLQRSKNLKIRVCGNDCSSFFDWTYETRYQSRSLSSLSAVMYFGTLCISIFFHKKTVLLFLSGIKDNQVLSD